ncbi:MAG: serine protein kinase RIO [Candidatus Woesearchaeota archaeon]
MAKPREKFKVWGDVFDNFTLTTIEKLTDKGCLEFLKSPISIGKEANVFSAKRGEGVVAVKIYRLETCDFNRMYDYIRADPRYSGLKKRRRLVVFAWCQREYRNLLKARELGVRVPSPIGFLNNVLVTEFIGDNDQPAPKLKDRIPENIQEFAEIVIEYMRKLYSGGFVHTDLSEYNILNWNEKPVFIDFSQATTRENPNFQQYLERDINNITRFFRKHGLNLENQKVLKEISKE